MFKNEKCTLSYIVFVFIDECFKILGVNLDLNNIIEKKLYRSL